jgi:hypothetical protein
VEAPQRNSSPSPRFSGHPGRNTIRHARRHISVPQLWVNEPPEQSSADDKGCSTAAGDKILTGTHLWADRFEGSLGDVFDLQDKVAASVARVIEPEFQAAEMRSSARRAKFDLSAYDFYLRAFAAHFPITKERICQAWAYWTAEASDEGSNRTCGASSMRCGCMNWVSSTPARRRSLATE